MTIKKVVLTGAVLLALGSGVATTSSVYAAEDNATHAGFFQNLVQFMSQKFGLDKTQVQNAMTEFHTQQRGSMTPRPTLTPQQMADKDKERLDALVSAGKITADQETQILAELASLREKYKPGSTMDKKAMHEETVEWAKSKGIDSSYVLPGPMMGRGWGHGGGGM